MTSRSETAAIVVAGGVGERFGRPGGKQLAEVCGLPVLAWALRALDASARFGLIVLVCPGARGHEYTAAAVEPAALSTPVVLAPSGPTRQQSVLSGLSTLSPEITTVAVHDGARPLLTPETICAALGQLESSGADGVVVAHPSFDTVKLVEDSRIAETPERSRFWLAQTPQVFRRSILESSYEEATAEGFLGTDDSSLVERAGGRVLVVEGPRENIKVTVDGDLDFVATVLRRRGAVPGVRPEAEAEGES